LLPLVLYQGIATGDDDNRFRSLLDSGHEALFPYVPDFKFILIDLLRFSDEQIKGGVVARVMLIAMKYALRDELPEKLFEMLRLLSDLADKKKGSACLELLFRYLVQATDKLSKTDFQKALSAIPEKGDGSICVLGCRAKLRGRRLPRRRLTATRFQQPGHGSNVGNSFIVTPACP